MKTNEGTPETKTALSELTLGMIGCGNMGKALARAWVESGQLHASQLLISAKSSAAQTAQELGASAVSAREALSADVVVLAFKPQQLSEVSAQLNAPRAPLSTSHVKPRLVLSLLAGVSADALQQHHNLIRAQDLLVRLMPNIPVERAAGVTLAYTPQPLSPTTREVVEALFGAVGLLEWLDKEALFHVGTALSGCGPAYFWLMIDALSDAGVALGLNRALARRLAAQTMLGSGLMALDQHPGLLKDRVTSPGGVTIEGVRALERAGVRSALIEAVACATSRSEALDPIKNREP